MKAFQSLMACSGLALALSSVAPLSGAEPDARPPRRSDPPGDGPRVQRFMQPPPRGAGFPMEAVLNEEQRAAFREEMNGQRDKLRSLDEKSARLRRELDEALFAEKLDEKTVREKSAALSELEVERALMRARAFAKVRPSLTEEQLERLKTLRAETAQGPRGGEGGFRQGPGRQPDQFRRPGDREPDEVLPPPAPPRSPDQPPR